jgi:hypothetical protein
MAKTEQLRIRGIEPEEDSHLVTIPSTVLGRGKIGGQGRDCQHTQRHCQVHASESRDADQNLCGGKETNSHRAEGTGVGVSHTHFPLRACRIKIRVRTSG